MISQAENKNTVLYPHGNTDDIIRSIIDCYNSDYAQVSELADSVPEGSVVDQCRWVFDLVDKNITYQMDPLKKQWIRTPARLWSDREGDCKSYSIFICSMLRCLGIPHLFRFACYGSDEPTHVYAVALDEQGREVIVDPVYRDSKGKALFNKECPYTKILNMKGSTVISRLSGVSMGSVPSVEMIAVNRDNIPRIEQDFLIRLNNLNSLYQGAVMNEDIALSGAILNRMDLASLVVACFEMELPMDNVLPCVLTLWDKGRFNTPAGVSEEERNAVMNAVLDDVLKIHNLFMPNESAVERLLELCDLSTPGFDVSQFLGGEKPLRAMGLRPGVSGTASSAQVQSVQKTLIDCAEYFMYTFIPDAAIGNYPPAVAEKREYYMSVYADIARGGVMEPWECVKTINDAIFSRHGISGDNFLLAVKNGDIPVVSGGFIAVLAAILPLLGAIAEFFEKMFGKSKTETEVELDINKPSVSDGMGIISESTAVEDGLISSGSGNSSSLLETSTPTKTVASTNWLGIALAVGILGAFLFGDKKKKK